MEKIYTSLQKAVIEQQIEVVLNIVAEGVQESDLNTSLDFAIQSRNLPIIKLLIDAGANVLESNLILDAIQSQNVDVLTLFLSAIGDVNKRDKLGYTLLRHAIRLRSLNFVKFLLDSGANVYTEPQEEPFLHEAIKTRNMKVVKLLLDAGANYNAENEDKSTPLHFAIEYYNDNVFKLILGTGTNLNVVNKDQNTPLNLAVLSQKPDVVKLLLDAGANVKVQNCVSQWKVPVINNPLHSAIQHGNISILQLLVNAGADVNSKNENDSSPLHLAIQYYHDEVSELLLQLGADINAKDDYGNTPLHTAVEWKNENVVKLLLGAGASVNIKNSIKCTPLHLAIQFYQDDIFDLILRACADLNAVNMNGDTPLHLAIIFKKTDVVKQLLDAGNNVNARNLYNQTPLHHSIQYYEDDIFKLLSTASGVDLSAEDSAGNTLFHTAAFFQRVNVMKLLLNAGVNFNLRNKNNDTPFMLFAKKFTDKKNKRDYFKFFLENIDCNLVDAKGRNILTFILESNRYLNKRKLFYKLILEHIAKLKILNYEIDQTLLDAISRKSDYEKYFKVCIEELEEAKSIQLPNCWVTFLNLLVDTESKFVRYAGNKDLVEGSMECKEKFPIYGATMNNNISKGIVNRKSFDGAINILSYSLPTFNPTHLIIKDVLNALSEEDWKMLCEKKRSHDRNT